MWRGSCPGPGWVTTSTKAYAAKVQRTGAISIDSEKADSNDDSSVVKAAAVGEPT